MKKTVLFSLAMLFNIAITAQSSVTITPLRVNYSATPPTVTFGISWPANSRGTINGQRHDSKVWLWVNYRPASAGQTATDGDWQRALVSNPSAGTVAAGNKGFWLQGASGSYAATLTVALSNVSEKFNWCAYVSDNPPNARILPAGGYQLYGTPPFIVDGVALGAGVTTYNAGKCIKTITDATDNPGGYVPLAPVVSTTSPPARCGAGAVKLTATASGGTTTAMTYSWIVGGGKEQKTTIGTYSTPSMPVGSTTYSVTLRNANNCASSAQTGTITVTGIPTLSVSASPSTACTGAPVKFTATVASGATTAMTYTWNIAGVSTTTTANTYSKTFAAVGNNTYSASVKNANGCTSAATEAKTITVNAGQEISGANNPVICAGETAALTVTGGSGTYSWVVGNAAAVTTTTGSYTTPAIQTTTTYTVTLKYPDNCSSPAATGTITVDNAPAATPTITGAAAAGCPSSMATYTLTSGGGDGLAYQWLRDGNVLSGATSTVLTSHLSGSFTCAVKSVNGGCTAISNQKVAYDVTCGEPSCTNCSHDPKWNACCVAAASEAEARAEFEARLSRTYCWFNILNLYRSDPNDPNNNGWGIYFEWCKEVWQYRKVVK
ncbi:MAG: hypothetical protein LBU42_06055 [Prevotellaceae bacterium]|nr:hypothetical protein [Prevotellaceae bacterium]